MTRNDLNYLRVVATRYFRLSHSIPLQSEITWNEESTVSLEFVTAAVLARVCSSALSDDTESSSAVERYIEMGAGLWLNMDVVVFSNSQA